MGYILMKEKRCALLFPGRRRIATEPQESDTVAVLRVKLHCQACVLEVTRGLQQIHGVGDVSVDRKAEIISVKGRNLDVRKLCEGLWRKTGKRCEVLLFSSIEELMRHQQQLMSSTTSPPLQKQQEVSAQPTLVEDASSHGVITVANGPPHSETTLLQSSDHIQEIHEPRIEIKQQTHTVIYGWPSQFQSPPSHWATNNSADYFVHDSQFHYEELFSEENPNACKIM